MQAALDKLFDVPAALDHPVTVRVLVALGVVLGLAVILTEVLRRTGRLTGDRAREVRIRTLAWMVMVPLMLAPVLLGSGCTILAITMLSLFCYREFARATGFFRHRAISATVVAGILALSFATYDHWYDFFTAVPTLTIAAIAIVALARDEPKGYIQRVGLGVLAFVLFGVCFGHLAYMANDDGYRPIIILIVLCVEANDVFAFISGRLFGRSPLAPKTSGNKTLGGSIGALVLTTALFVWIGHEVFAGTVLDTTTHLVTMGAMLSVVGQFGDLAVSSIKRDLDIKDMGALIPGHGGLLDRFDSLMFVAPAMFHYIGYFRSFGLDAPVRIMTGGIVG